MADQQKGDKPKGFRARREEEGAEKSGFDRALEPDILSEGVTCLVGLVGQSTREGYRVLFLSMDMNSRVEIRDEDIVYTEKLSAEESPFGSLGGTRICVKKGATLDYSRTTAQKVQAEALAQNEFDLDIRLGQRGSARQGAQGRLRQTWIATDCNCTNLTCFDTFCDVVQGDDTLGTLATACLPTQCGATCGMTRCAGTCLTECDNTCWLTRCGTCDTCRDNTCPQTQCGTCQTCDTQCPTRCGTCETCPTRCRTECGNCPTEGNGATCRPPCVPQ